MWQLEEVQAVLRGKPQPPTLRWDVVPYQGDQEGTQDCARP